MSGFETRALFPELQRHSMSVHESAGVRDIESETAHTLSAKKIAKAQGQKALFEMGIGGIYITQELF